MYTEVNSMSEALERVREWVQQGYKVEVTPLYHGYKIRTVER
jgi:hypothetical protein